MWSDRCGRDEEFEREVCRSDFLVEEEKIGAAQLARDNLYFG